MRYFFHVTGAADQPDQQGQEIGSLSDARIQAVRFASDYLRERPELVWLGEEFRVEVCDEKKRCLFTFIAVGVDTPASDGRLRI